MSRRVSVALSILVILSVSGLALALPLANAQSTVVVKIPVGAGSGPTAAPGYSPENVTVVIGVNNTVTWTNNDTAGAAPGTDHTVVSLSVPPAAAAFNSGIMAPGAVFTQTFTVPGTYEYHCSLHAWMTGSVVVLASTSAPEFPASYLALILFAAIAAVIVVAARLRPTISAPSIGSSSGTTKGRFVQTAT
jgi:plastocyanin